MKAINYRGIKPAAIVTVIEGDGVAVPFAKVQYVLSFEDRFGISTPVTLGKIVPLSEEERAMFSA